MDSLKYIGIVFSVMLEGFQEGINWASMMPRGINLSAGWAPDRSKIFHP